MIYEHVCLESFGYALPPEVVTSEELETWLQPLYDRIGLHVGRLELMTGIRERRFWAKGALPSEGAALAGADALARAGVKPSEVECLIHCSVSTDFVEPATSTAVHRLLGLGGDVLNFDLSNACLGMVSGVLMLANMIELGQITTGLAVCGENARPLVENTVACMNADLSLTRRTIKDQFASLTIGSCAAAILVRALPHSQSRHRLLGAAHCVDSSNNHLCQGDAQGGMTDNSAPLMATDSHELMIRGIEVAGHMWQKLKATVGWTEKDPTVICTHQVGKAHSALLFSSLGLDPAKNFASYPQLGNCGSASLPVTCALAEEAGVLKPGAKLAMLGIGSGINCAGLAVEW
ncbi:MAG: 3-oxoacyl-ACP synthase III [Lentisphaerae bacterium]|nr:3-oxoacyl-ACP synthase III [Lentisphaerota bacterium]